MNDEDAALPETGSEEYPVRIGVFDVVRPLASGGMGRVFLVRDTTDGASYALKLLRSLRGDESATANFRREFRAMLRLNHPNVVRVIDSGMFEGRPWFTMEYVDGTELRKLVHDWIELDPSDRFARVISVVVQTARALAYIHERGIVHRDVSCANLLVTPEGSVKLMDFGLAAAREDGPVDASKLFGTVAYLAPEQIRGDAVDGRADLYALGVVLYQLLTGRKPFQAHTPKGFLDRHLNEAPRPPRDLDPLVPELLEQVCLRLLAKSPSDRYASARHLLGVLGDVEDVAGDARWPPRLVGRTPYQAWLRDVLDDVVAGRRGGASLVRGGAGAGKTRLLDLAEMLATRRGLTVARGRSRSDDRPFGAFATIYEALADNAVDPRLKAVFEATESELRLERFPVIAAFRDLVARRAPVVLLIDDLHLADGGTRDLVDFLVRNAIDLGDLPVVVVATVEAADGARLSLLHGVRNLEQVVCGPFTAAEVEELVVGLVSGGPAATALARRLFEETGGAPRHIADMLRGLVDEGVIAREGGRWRLTLGPEALTEQTLPLPDSLRDLLAERLHPLPPVARDLARTIALTQRGVDLEALLAVMPEPEPVVLQAISTLLNTGVLVELRVAGKDRFDLAHGRFRDLLVDELSEDERRARHQRIGELLERQHRYAPFPVVEDLAWHFEQARLAPKAYAYLVETARKHVAQSSYEEGVHLYDRAARAEAEARPLMLLDEADRLLAALHLERGKALFHLGQWDAALEAASEAAKLAEVVRDPELASRAATERGTVLRNVSQLVECEVLFNEALVWADEAGKAGLRLLPLYHLAALRWARGDLEGADTLWNEALVLARVVGDVPAEARVYNGLGILALCRGQSSDAQRFMEQSADLFDRVGMVEPLAVTRANLIELYKLTGRLGKALRLADRTVARAREARHLHGVALGLVWRARVLEAIGRHDDARRNAQQGLQLAFELGTKEEQVLGLRTMVQVQFATGHGRFASARVDHLLALLAESDVEGVLPQVRAMQARCLLARGERAAAEGILAELGGSHSFPHIQVRADLEACTALRELGHNARALALAENALHVARSASYRLYEMEALQEIARVAPSPEAREEARARSQTLARALAGSLERSDASLFHAEGAGSGRR